MWKCIDQTYSRQTLDSAFRREDLYFVFPSVRFLFIKVDETCKKDSIISSSHTLYRYRFFQMFPTRSAIGGAFQPTTLDVDERILDRNLRIVEDDVGNGDGGSEVEQMLFGGGGNQQSSSKKASITPVLKEASRPLMPEPELPSVEVTPEPGICIKTKNQQVLAWQ